MAADQADDDILDVLRDPAHGVWGYGNARSKGWAVSSDAAVRQVAAIAELSPEDARALIRQVLDLAFDVSAGATIESRGLRPRAIGERPLSVDIELFFVPLP